MSGYNQPGTHYSYHVRSWWMQIRYTLIFSCQPIFWPKLKKKNEMKQIAQTGPTFSLNELLDVLVCVWLWTTRDKICVCIWRMGLVVTCKKNTFYRSRHNIHVGFKLLLHFRRIIEGGTIRSWKPVGTYALICKICKHLPTLPKPLI